MVLPFTIDTNQYGLYFTTCNRYLLIEFIFFTLTVEKRYTSGKVKVCALFNILSTVYFTHGCSNTTLSMNDY